MWVSLVPDPRTLKFKNKQENDNWYFRKEKVCMRCVSLVGDSSFPLLSKVDIDVTPAIHPTRKPFKHKQFTQHLSTNNLPNTQAISKHSIWKPLCTCSFYTCEHWSSKTDKKMTAGISGRKSVHEMCLFSWRLLSSTVVQGWQLK